MLRIFLSMVVAMMVSGCITPQIKYVDKIVYVPVKIDENLFKMEDIPRPPRKEQFVFLEPKNKDDIITLLKGQRDILVEYSQDLLKDDGMCRSRLSKIYTLQLEQVDAIKNKGQ